MSNIRHCILNFKQQVQCHFNKLNNDNNNNLQQLNQKLDASVFKDFKTKFVDYLDKEKKNIRKIPQIFTKPDDMKI